MHRNDQTAGQLEKGFGPEFETDKKQRVRLRLGRGLVSTNDKIEIDIEYLRAQLGL